MRDADKSIIRKSITHQAIRRHSIRFTTGLQVQQLPTRGVLYGQNTKNAVFDCIEIVFQCFTKGHSHEIFVLAKKFTTTFPVLSESPGRKLLSVARMASVWSGDNRNSIKHRLHNGTSTNTDFRGIILPSCSCPRTAGNAQVACR